jgi:signal transduction histidine kinase
VSPECATLLIEDDGVGIADDAQSNRLSHGIAGMRQRVRALHGDFAIGRRAEGGTIIEVNIPLPSTPASAADAQPETEPVAGAAPESESQSAVETARSVGAGTT